MTTTVKTRPDRLHFYRDDLGEWRWTFSSGQNGNTLAVASEGYTKRSNTVIGAARTLGVDPYMLRALVIVAVKHDGVIESKARQLKGRVLRIEVTP